jgi:hypothetical protein
LLLQFEVIGFRIRVCQEVFADLFRLLHNRGRGLAFKTNLDVFADPGFRNGSISKLCRELLTALPEDPGRSL